MLLTTAFILALCSVACAVLLFIKLPEWLKRFLIKHQLFSDLFATIGTGVILSSVSLSLASMLASALSGVGISGLLFLEKKRGENSGGVKKT